MCSTNLGTPALARAAVGPEISDVELWKPQPRAKPDGRGEGNEAQAAHQEGMPLRNRQPVALSYCPSD